MGKGILEENLDLYEERVIFYGKQQEFFDVYLNEYGDFTKMHKELHDDLFETFLEAQKIGSQKMYRDFIKQFFSYVEFFIYKIKMLSISRDRINHEPTFSVQERAILLERKYILKSNGEAGVKKRNNLKLFDNLKFAIKCFSKVNKFDYDIDYDKEPNWSKFRKLKRIRNRLVHPRSSDQLTIDKEEKEILYDVFLWFMEYVSTKMIGLCKDVTNQLADELSIRRKELKKMGGDLKTIIDRYKRSRSNKG